MAKPGKFFSSKSKSTSPKVASHQPNDKTKAATVVPSGNAANVSKPGAKAELKPNQGNISAHAIAEAAYFLWLERGGNETVNWLEAEAALKRKNVVTQ